MLIEAVSDKLVYVLIGVCFVIAMITKALTAVVTGHAREKSRREIAAYIAEGSLDPDQGERLMKADVGPRSSCRL